MEQNQSALFTLTIDPVTKLHLAAAAKWARFLAILGIILLLLMVLGTAFGMSMWSNVFKMSMRTNGIEDENMANTARIAMIVYMVVVALIAFFPMLFLLRFANSALSAINSNDQNRLNVAMQNLKAYFRFLGVIAIIFLVFFAISIAIGVAALGSFSQ